MVPTSSRKMLWFLVYFWPCQIGQLSNHINNFLLKSSVPDNEHLKWTLTTGQWRQNKWILWRQLIDAKKLLNIEEWNDIEATFTFWGDKSSSKMPKKLNLTSFWKAFKVCGRSVTRQVNFNRTKFLSDFQTLWCTSKSILSLEFPTFSSLSLWDIFLIGTQLLLLLVPIWFLQAFICIMQPSKWFDLTLWKNVLWRKKMQLNVWIRASLKFSGWLSVDLISNSDFLVLLGTEKKKGPSKRWSALLSTRFYKRLHQRPNTLYFRVEPGLAMIIPDMNSSTTISKLNLPLLSISAFFPLSRKIKALAFIFPNSICKNG